MIKPWAKGLSRRSLIFKALTTNEDVIKATHEFLPVVVQTELWNDETKLRAIIEYPVKTMNINREQNIYQVDTGHVEGISLAFVAFNASHFADFIIECPTPIRENGKEGKEICRVYHYSRRVSLMAKNRLYAITS